MQRLVVFISSTADLRSERDAVERALAGLDIEGSRFESWPSSPHDPLTECLQRVEQSDAIVLLLGARYGSTDQSGVSITQREYRHAREFRKRVFAYVLHAAHREKKQQEFISEVEANHFRCPVISGPEELEVQVRRSFLDAFTRSFRGAHFGPVVAPPTGAPDSDAASDITLPRTALAVAELLKQLYDEGQDQVIANLAIECEDKFPTSTAIMNIVYMAEVNLGLTNRTADEKRVARAIEFWGSDEAKSRCAPFSLLYCQGNGLQVLGRHDAAIERYTESLSQESSQPECWKNLGSAYLAVENTDLAEKCYKRALQLNPLLFEALYCTAALIMRRDDEPSEALSYLNRIILARLSPVQRAAVHGWKAAIYLKMHGYPEAVASVEDALTDDDDANWAWACGGRVYSLVQNEGPEWLAAANGFWNRFVKRHPHRAEAWAQLGYGCRAIGRASAKGDWTSDALEYFNKAITLGYDGDGLVWDRIGHIHQDRGDWVQAERAFRKAYEKDAGQFGYCLGVSLIHLEQYESALPIVLAAAEKHQPDALSWFQVGVCYDRLGNHDEAIAAYERSSSLDPEYALSLFNLGGVHFNRKDLHKALDVWRTAFQRFPDHEQCDVIRAGLGPKLAAALDSVKR